MSLGELLYDVSGEASAACWGLSSSRRVDTLWEQPASYQWVKGGGTFLLGTLAAWS